MVFEFKREIRKGVLLGSGFIALNLLFGISIGFPLLSFDTFLEKFGIVSILAPFAEEILWGSFLLTLFSFLPLPLNLAINIITFTVFHFVAYGASFEAASASFIGAAVFRLSASSLVVKDQQNLRENLPVPLAAIVAHLIVNTYLIIKLTGLVIVGVG